MRCAFCITLALCAGAAGERPANDGHEIIRARVWLTRSYVMILACPAEMHLSRLCEEKDASVSFSVFKLSWKLTPELKARFSY